MVTVLEVTLPHSEVTTTLYFVPVSGKDGTDFVKGAVVLETAEFEIAWLYEKMRDNKITSLSPHLQRILLERVWKACDWTKSKSYIRDFWKGLSKSTQFLFVPFDLILINLSNKISSVIYFLRPICFEIKGFNWSKTVGLLLRKNW